MFKTCGCCVVFAGASRTNYARRRSFLQAGAGGRWRYRCVGPGVGVGGGGDMDSWM